MYHLYISLARSLIGCRTSQSTGDLYLEPGQLIWMSTGRIPNRRIPQCHNNISCQIATIMHSSQSLDSDNGDETELHNGKNLTEQLPGLSFSRSSKEQQNTWFITSVHVLHQ
jgi:hypothetical protein